MSPAEVAEALEDGAEHAVDEWATILTQAAALIHSQGAEVERLAAALRTIRIIADVERPLYIEERRAIINAVDRALDDAGGGCRDCRNGPGDCPEHGVRALMNGDDAGGGGT
jgi:hypothetical protein